MTRSRCFHPASSWYSPAWSSALLSLLASALYRVSSTKVLLPDPDTPVTQVNVPRGTETSMFLRFRALAPLSMSQLSEDGILSEEAKFLRPLPLRYAPVMDWGVFCRSARVPLA